jgi:hypothetical protein
VIPSNRHSGRFNVVKRSRDGSGSTQLLTVFVCENVAYDFAAKCHADDPQGQYAVVELIFRKHYGPVED